MTWTNVDLSSVESSDIHLRASSQEIPQPSITEIIWKIKYLKFHSNLPGANELIDFSRTIWSPPLGTILTIISLCIIPVVGEVGVLISWVLANDAAGTLEWHEIFIMQQVRWEENITLSVNSFTPGQIYLIISWYLHVRNGVAVAAYSRLASRSQEKFQTMKLSPLSALRAAAPAQSTISTCRSLGFRQRPLLSGEVGGFLATATPFRTWRYQLIIRYSSLGTS